MYIKFGVVLDVSEYKCKWISNKLLAISKEWSAPNNQGLCMLR
jgi:hypothetical protein